jgi:hypothetical protein
MSRRDKHKVLADCRHDLDGPIGTTNGNESSTGGQIGNWLACM